MSYLPNNKTSLSAGLSQPAHKPVELNPLVKAKVEAENGFLNEKFAKNYDQNHQVNFFEKYPQNPAFNLIPNKPEAVAPAPTNPAAINLLALLNQNQGDAAAEQVDRNMTAQRFLDEDNLNFAELFLGRALTELELSTKIINADQLQHSRDYLNYSHRYTQLDPKLTEELHQYLLAKNNSIAAAPVASSSSTTTVNSNAPQRIELKDPNQISMYELDLANFAARRGLKNSNYPSKLKLMRKADLEHLFKLLNIPMDRSLKSNQDKADVLTHYFNRNKNLLSGPPKREYSGIHSASAHSSSIDTRHIGDEDEEEEKYPVRLTNLAIEHDPQDTSFSIFDPIPRFDPDNEVNFQTPARL